MSQSDAEKTMTLDEVLAAFAGIVDRFTERAKEAQRLIAEELQQLADDPAFQATRDKHQALVERIYVAEMARMAKAVEEL